MYLLQNFAEKDQEILELFGSILNKTDERGSKISEISDRLEDELLMLGGFLHILNSLHNKKKIKIQ
jgi:hypothetical protein